MMSRSLDSYPLRQRSHALAIALHVVLSLSLSLSSKSFGKGSADDHLVPIQQRHGVSALYDQLWERELLVSPGEVARFVGLPGTIGVETAVSVYRASDKQGSLPGNYWVTATQATDRLWNLVNSPGSDPLAENKARVVRCDAPISESTALAIHKSWLAMLQNSRVHSSSNVIMVDSSRELFSATDDSGHVLWAQNLGEPKPRTRMLIDIALSLLEYCGVAEDQRTLTSQKIEKVANKLFERVSNKAK